MNDALHALPQIADNNGQTDESSNTQNFRQRIKQTSRNKSFWFQQYEIEKNNWELVNKFLSLLLQEINLKHLNKYW